jgi:Glycosyl transferase family 2
MVGVYSSSSFGRSNDEVLLADTMGSPLLSVVVVAHNMARELPRTLTSLTAAYQQEADPQDYEVIVVDNGSSTPVDPDIVRSFGGNFSLLRIDNASPSPVGAINAGARASRGRVLGLLLDGARLLTPGVLKYVKLAFGIYPDATVATLAWHLGPKAQQDSISEGYDQQEEDRLLREIAWPEDGHRLFEISTLADSSAGGYFSPLGESNALFLTRAAFQSLGGYDTAFEVGGGGLANLDFYRRACQRPAPLVVLLGEGTFHQVHGGRSTNVPRAECEQLVARWQLGYEKLRGEPFRPPSTPRVYLGSIPDAALMDILCSARAALAGPPYDARDRPERAARTKARQSPEPSGAFSWAPVSSARRSPR